VKASDGLRKGETPPSINSRKVLEVQIALQHEVLNRQDNVALRLMAMRRCWDGILDW